MAIVEEIRINVVDSGLDEATAKTNALASATKNVAKEMSNTGNSVLENGGAMGLLNDATGGYAMMVKDAVEASVLFTKSQKILAVQQKVMAFATGTSTGALKIFRLALISTGIGALVVGIGLLIANFDKVKEAVMRFIPGLKIVGDIISNLVTAVTDFIGVTSDATRALDAMVAKSEESLKRSEHFLEANGDKYDEYTQRKIKSTIDFNKKVIELNNDETLSEQEKLKRIEDFRKKQNREVIQADADRAEELAKKRKEAQDKIDEENKKASDKAKAEADKRAEQEKSRIESINKLLEDYRKKEEDAKAKTELDKINLDEKRAIAELERLRANEEQKAQVRAYYNGLRVEEENRINEALAELEIQKQDAQRELALQQKEWEIENELDPITKGQKELDFMYEKYELEQEQLEREIEDKENTDEQKLEAINAYNLRKQEFEQQVIDKEAENAKLKIEQEKLVQEAKNDLVSQGLDVASNGVALLKQLDIKSKAVQKGALIAESAIGIAKIIQNTMTANAGVTAKYSPIPGGAALAATEIAFNSVSAGILVASNVAATAKGLQALGGGGAPSASASIPAQTSAPSFNLVQGTGANQIANAIGSEQTPLKAYVTSGDVSSGQSLDRNIIENSKF
jgi:hypothetical protein